MPKKYTKEEIRRIRNRFKCRHKLKSIIRERDNNVCQKCGSNDYIEVTHIKGIKEFPELAYDKNNLRCLCRKCSRRRHRKWLDISKI